jgi:mannose-6-phosphate isomerase-like protein (cupin superfamily)
MSNVTFFKKSNPSKIVDLGSKVITKFTAPGNDLEINHMKISGRHPENPEQFIYETDVHFMVYVLKGSAKISTESKTFDVEEGDVLDFPPKSKFAVEGNNFEYLAIENPAWFPEQAYIVDKEGNVLEDTQI